MNLSGLEWSAQQETTTKACSATQQAATEMEMEIEIEMEEHSRCSELLPLLLLLDGAI